MIVNQKTLAQCLGLSLRQIQRLQTDGIIHRDKAENGYHLEECVRQYIDYKVNSETGRGDGFSKEKMQAEHEKVKMDISKLKLRRMRKEVLEASSVERYWSDAVIRIRNKVMALPSKIVMATIGDDAAHAIETATKLCEDALDDLADYDPELLDSDIDYDDEPDDEDEDESQG
ncbi:MAG: hypothetical protein LUC16_02655 [Coprobacillus sp.]|nr:hypothetical protein [Coprobacillus sp.]